MPTEAQKTRKVEWEREAENSSATTYFGFRCQVFYSPTLGERVSFILDPSGKQVWEDRSDKSQRQAEIKAERELKKLAKVYVSKSSGFYGKMGEGTR